MKKLLIFITALLYTATCLQGMDTTITPAAIAETLSSVATTDTDASSLFSRTLINNPGILAHIFEYAANYDANNVFNNDFSQLATAISGKQSLFSSCKALRQLSKDPKLAKYFQQKSFLPLGVFFSGNSYIRRNNACINYLASLQYSTEKIEGLIESSPNTNRAIYTSMVESLKAEYHAALEKTLTTYTQNSDIVIASCLDSCTEENIINQIRFQDNQKCIRVLEYNDHATWDFILPSSPFAQTCKILSLTSESLTEKFVFDEKIYNLLNKLSNIETLEISNPDIVDNADTLDFTQLPAHLKKLRIYSTLNFWTRNLISALRASVTHPHIFNLIPNDVPYKHKHQHSLTVTTNGTKHDPIPLSFALEYYELTAINDCTIIIDKSTADTIATTIQNISSLISRAINLKKLNLKINEINEYTKALILDAVVRALPLKTIELSIICPGVGLENTCTILKNIAETYASTLEHVMREADGCKSTFLFDKYTHHPRELATPQRINNNATNSATQNNANILIPALVNNDTALMNANLVIAPAPLAMNPNLVPDQPLQTLPHCQAYQTHLAIAPETQAWITAPANRTDIVILYTCIAIGLMVIFFQKFNNFNHTMVDSIGRDATLADYTAMALQESRATCAAPTIQDNIAMLIAAALTPIERQAIEQALQNNRTTESIKQIIGWGLLAIYEYMLFQR